MPRVPPLLEAEWKDDQRDLLARLLPDDPVDPLVATLLHAPEIVEAVLPMTRYVTDESTLSPRHRLLLGLRTAWLERSDVLWGGYAARATSDLPEMTALTVGQGESEDVAGQSLLRMADELVLNVSVTDSTWTNLASDHDVAWLMDAVESVAHVSFLCCLARSLGVQPASPALARPEADRPAVPPRQPTLTAARIEPTPGDGIAVLRTFARHPALARARRPRSAFISGKSPLTPHDRETLILRIGWDCQAEYEWAKHVGSVGHARDHGIDPERGGRRADGAPRLQPRRPTDASGRRPASGLKSVRRHLDRPPRAIRARRGHERHLHRQCLPIHLNVAQCLRRPA